MVGRGEVAGRSAILLKFLVVVELGAVVEGDGVEGVLGVADDQERGVGDGTSGSVLEESDDGEAALAFDEGEEAVLGVFAHDGIALPVADARAVVDAFWSLADVAFSMQDAACRPAAVTLPADLGHDAGEAEEVAALALVAADVAIDGLVTGYRLALSGEHTHDLLRAQTLAEGEVHILEDRL